MAKKSALIGRMAYVKDHISWFTGAVGRIVDVDGEGYWVECPKLDMAVCLQRWEFVVPKKKED